MAALLGPGSRTGWPINNAGRRLCAGRISEGGHPTLTLVGGHVDVIRRSGSVAEVPPIEEFSVFIEDLNAPVAAVVDVQPALIINGDACTVLK